MNGKQEESKKELRRNSEENLYFVFCLDGSRPDENKILCFAAGIVSEFRHAPRRIDGELFFFS